MQDNAGLTIRRMTPRDIPFGMELKDLAGWNQLPADWERLLAWEPEGCFVALWEGRPAGTATTITYQGRFGWVGMVLVHPDLRRRGVGTALLRACIAYLQGAGVAAVRLDATPVGKELYDTLGFREEYGVSRCEAVAPGTVGAGLVPPAPDATSRVPTGCAGVRAVTDASWEGILALDQRAFGADRSRVLESLRREPQAQGFVAPCGPTVEAYAFVRPGMHAHQVGPWVAESAEAAGRVLDGALSSRPGRRLLLDIPLANPQAAALAGSLGFQPRRSLLRLCLGENLHPGRPELTYGLAGLEIG